MTNLTACLAICDGAQPMAPVVTIAKGSVFYNPWWHDGALWVLNGGQWVRSGTFRVDGTGARAVAGHSGNWGTFEMQGNGLGVFSGTWAWFDQDGFGSGKEIARAGRVIAVDFLHKWPTHLPGAPVCAEHGQTAGRTLEIVIQ